MLVGDIWYIHKANLFWKQPHPEKLNFTSDEREENTFNKISEETLCEQALQMMF